MIKNITHSIFYPGRNYFHPAISQCGNGLMMTMQTIGASDTYGPVVYALSSDNGKTWGNPRPVKSLDTKEFEDGIKEGIADVRPLFHKPTGTVIASGCNTHYGKYGCAAWDPELKGKAFRQFPVYAVYDRDGKWSERKILSHEFFSECGNWRTACAQAIVLEDENILFPIYFHKNHEQDNYSVCTLKCSFDGTDLIAEKVSNTLSFPEKRGFLEPSLIYSEGKYYMTIRAEDDHAYLSISADGLNWESPSAWRWDDGTYLKTSTTQQHWISSGKELYLAYTREDECNKDVMRWRAPLFAARVIPEKKCLLRNTERILFPLKRHGEAPNLLGNFHAVDISPGRSIVSDGSLWLEGKDNNAKSRYYSEVWVSEIEYQA